MKGLRTLAAMTVAGVVGMVGVGAGAAPDPLSSAAVGSRLLAAPDAVASAATTASGFSLRSGGAADVGVGANRSVWVIGTNSLPGGFGIYHWNGSGWGRVPGEATMITVGPHGDALVANSSGRIYHWNGGGWGLLPGGATDVGVGANGSVWVIGTNAMPGGFGIYHWTGSGWVREPGAGRRIAVGPHGDPWVVNSSGRIYHWNGRGWTLLPGRATDVGVGANGSAWVIGTNPVSGGRGIYRWTGTGWLRVAGGGVRIAVDPGGKPWLVNSSHRIYSYGPIPSGTVVCSSKIPPASPMALCGPYSWPADSGNDGTNTYVGSDGWNNQPGETYDLQVVNPGDWTDTVTAAPCQCVSAYPSVEQYGPNNPLKVSAYTKITSTYAEAMNANSASVTHAAYDIWTGSSSNLFADETMIMNDRTASDPGCDSAILASPTFTEPSTGHQVTYDFCQSGSERQFIEHGNERAGSVDILAMFKWMEANGHLPATDLLGEVDYGWEVLSTGSRPQPFHLSGFSLTVLPTP